MAGIDILNPNLGLQNLLDPASERLSLPEARQFASNVVPETGLERHFELVGVARLIDQALIPTGVDERLLRPEVFRRNLREAFETLKDSRKPEVRKFVRDVLSPILEDEELYELYASLLVSD
jgi:hypothetical protein